MATPPPVRLTVLISGNGSNLQALIDSTTSTTSPLPATIIRVISNRKSAFGLTRAASAHIPTHYHNLVAYKTKYPGADSSEARQAYDKDLAALVLADKPDMVVCAGWMHILAPTFLDPMAAAGVPVINLHPALPGQFNGARAIERAHEAFQAGLIACTGVMIHYVIAEVDMGRPIVTRDVEIKAGEGIEALEDRIHCVEHELIVQGARMAIEELRAGI